MDLFLGNLLWYSLLFIVLVAVSVAGVFVGKKLRERKVLKENQQPEALKKHE